MQLDLEPGDFVINPKIKRALGNTINNKNRITVNFQNSGKKVIDINHVILEKLNNEN